MVSIHQWQKSEYTNENDTAYNPFLGQNTNNTVKFLGMYLIVHESTCKAQPL
jgi:hypothetical protein